MFHPMLITALRVILGALFIFSGLIKVFDLKGFHRIVASYGVLPRLLVKPAAYGQPFIETAIGLWLAADWQLGWAALATLAMLVVATWFVVAALLKKKTMENCGCYGAVIKVPLGWKKVVENLGWIALAAALAWLAW